MSTFTGIDPGLIHTGAVTISLEPALRAWRVSHARISGLDEAETLLFCQAHADNGPVFVEGYRPRSHFSGDADMVSAVRRFAASLPRSQVLNNTGVTKVVRKDLMMLLNVWSFPTITHHQDLRSAARIGLYGALKNEDLNGELTMFVTDWIQGNRWTLHT